MADTRRSVGRVPELARAWLEVAPDMREFLNTLQQVINDAQDEAGDVGSAIAFFMGSTFAGASGGWMGGAVGDGDKGDITVSSGGSVYTIDADVVSNTKLANMAQSTIKGRAVGAGTGDPTDLTATQATAILDNLVGDSGSGGTKGLAPAPAAGDAAAGKYLNSDGTWAVPAGTFQRTKALTNTVATGLFEIALASGTMCGGWVDYTIFCTDGTDYEVLTRRTYISAVNKGGTITPVVTDVGTTSAFSAGIGLAVISSLLAGASKVTFRLAATSLLTPTTLEARYAYTERAGQAVTIL